MLIRTYSHRAREQMERALGRKPEYFFTWKHSAAILGDRLASQFSPVVQKAREVLDLLDSE